MNLTLTPQIESIIQRKVESGSYDSANDVIVEALQLLEQRDRRIAWEKAIAVGDEQLARGEGREWTPELAERLKQEALEEERLGTPISEDVQP